ncbi:hypothetical protein P692DRAFT_20813803 [Suillus brevipes Sb2]|nr:hypothetical protein P692DRAFT_20813803 [Suillus brevipes Sb2]
MLLRRVHPGPRYLSGPGFVPLRRSREKFSSQRSALRIVQRHAQQYTVDQHPNAFWINISPNSKIAELKSAICVHREDGPLREVLPQVLVLWKLTTKFPISPHETIGERVQAINLDEIAVALKNDSGKVSEVYPDTAEKELDFIVHRAKDEALSY